MQSGALQYPRYMLRKQRVREMLTTQEGRDDRGVVASDAFWATLVFTQRQACSFVLNELVLRLPTFRTFLLTGACPPVSVYTMSHVLGRVTCCAGC